MSTSASSPMIMVASLGNPSPEYDGSRHSVGHYLLDWYAGAHGVELDSQVGLFRPKDGQLQNVYFHRNKGYMNESGSGLRKPWARFCSKAHAQNRDPVLVVVSDELDAPLGKVKVRKQNSSPRGHNGLRSIQQKIGKDYTGISVGIGSGDKHRPRDAEYVSKYVIGKFTPDERDVLETAVGDKFVKLLKEMARGKHIHDRNE